jgi:hypothetical protein
MLKVGNVGYEMFSVIKDLLKEHYEEEKPLKTEIKLPKD